MLSSVMMQVSQCYAHAVLLYKNACCTQGEQQGHTQTDRQVDQAKVHCVRELKRPLLCQLLGCCLMT